MILLDAETKPAKFYAISLSHEEQDALNYHKEHFHKVEAIYEPFVTAPVGMKLCNVDETIFKR